LSPERRAVVVERRLELQAEGAVEVVLGNRPFEVVNVGGTDVRPFLDKTDGEKLTNEDGLDTGLVSTVKLAANAATLPERYDSVGETDWVAAGIATGPITTRTTVFNTSITATGSEIIVDGSFFLRLQHSQDDVVLYVVVERLSSGGGGTVDVFLATTQSLAISGDGFVNGWQVISFSDTPPAGTVDYYVRVYHTYSIGSPGGFVTWKHSNRTMSFLETKR
jgi:hypothetical protein